MKTTTLPAMTGFFVFCLSALGIRLELTLGVLLTKKNRLPHTHHHTELFQSGYLSKESSLCEARGLTTAELYHP